METVALTLAEAAVILDPPMTAGQLRAIIAALGWKPAGNRHTGRRGRPWPVYDAARLMELHAALAPFLPDNRALMGARPHAQTGWGLARTGPVEALCRAG